jgi:cytochrome c oxidase assembly protein subunit 20
MASNAGPRPPNPNDKILNVWSKPIEQGDDGTTNHNAQPTLTDAVSSIKPDDFKNIAATPCARNAFLTGIASGFGAGGLRFVVRGRSNSSPEAPPISSYNIILTPVFLLQETPARQRTGR